MRYRETARTPNFDWSEMRLAQLKALLAEGLSASQIANEIGGVTRNAVIGIVHRKGLSFKSNGGRPRISKPKPLPKFRPKPAVKPLVLKAPNIPASELFGDIVNPEPISIDDLAIPIEQRRTLLTLRRHDCKWPVGDPKLEPDSFFFCGAIRKDDSPYCPHHDRRAKRD